MHYAYLNMSWCAKRINHCICNILGFKERIVGEKTVVQLLISATISENIGFH